jgi:hypothetical protein
MEINVVNMSRQVTGHGGNCCLVQIIQQGSNITSFQLTSDRQIFFAHLTSNTPAKPFNIEEVFWSYHET